MKLKQKKTTHNDLKKAVIDMLESYGFCVCNFYAGGFQNHQTSKYYPRKNTKGISDIVACSPFDGKFWAVEIKTDRDVLSPEQTNFLKNIIANKGCGLVVFNIDEFMEFLQDYKDGYTEMEGIKICQMKS